MIELQNTITKFIYHISVSFYNMQWLLKKNKTFIIQLFNNILLKNAKESKNMPDNIITIAKE